MTTKRRFLRVPVKKDIPVITQKMEDKCQNMHHIPIFGPCSSCTEDSYGDDCQECGGSLLIIKERIQVPWKLVKRIYKDLAIVAAEGQDREP